MKKLWKNLCACSLAMACTVGVSACGKEQAPTSLDLDGDGNVASWETLFGDEQHSSSLGIVGEISYINSADELLAINDNTDTRKIYVLNRDIDMGGREVSINLGKSEFYGLNYVISNFKFATISGEEIGTGAYKNTFVKSLFRNGTGVYGTRIFMGVQSVQVDNAERNSSYYISPLFNVPNVGDVKVKGKLSINSLSVDNRISSQIEASLLYSGMSIETVNANEESVLIKDITNIENSSVDGEIVVDNNLGSRVGMNIGSIASTLANNSTIYNCYAQVNIKSSCDEAVTNIAGIVGNNLGFISTCTYTGKIELNNTKKLSVLFGGGINIGGVVGTNNKFAEVKNCSTNASIDFINPEMEVSGNGSTYNIGGVCGDNDGGIIEYCQNDSNINISNLNTAVVGGLCGSSDNGVLSYNICRGNINATNIAYLTTSQVVGLSNKGYFEKILTTTGINIDNSQIVTSYIKVGMVTVFDNNDTSPYFKRIMVDGITQIFTKETDNSKVDYKQGLRYSYEVQVGQQDGEDIYDVILPDVFEYLYKTEGCKLYKYSLVGEVKNEDVVSIVYPDSKVGTSTGTTRWMIDYMDFKNYLNHNEVSLDTTLNLKNLHFTLNDKKTRMESYFGDAKYNGEMAYFDREFTESFTHKNNSLGSCEYDKNDEMLSFVYNLISSNNGKDKEFYVIKVSDSYINKLPEDIDWVDGLSANANTFVDRVANVFGCLSTPVSITNLDADGNNVLENESGNTIAKYVEIKFSDNECTYRMKIDISNLQDRNTVTTEDNNYLLYVTFIIGSKSYS